MNRVLGMKRVAATALVSSLLLASAAWAQATDTPDREGPLTETMEQSKTQGQVNGLPSATATFLTEQGAGNWLASELVGKPVQNQAHETVGEIKDLVTDQDGRLIGIVVGVGGFLGIGEKDVAIRFEDVRWQRNAEGDATIMSNVSKQTLGAAPAYRTLDEQSVVHDEEGQVKHTY